MYQSELMFDASDVCRTVNGNKKDGSPVPSATAPPLIGPAAVIDRGLDLSTNTVDAANADRPDQPKCPIQSEEDMKTLETKNDP